MDCVKIFSSIYDVKPVGFRLLQYNFVNSTGEPWMPDHLTLYDGDLYNYTTKPMVTIKVDGSDQEKYLHKTTKSNAMSIKFHATGARESLGFVAEVVTIPLSVVGINRDIKHNMSFSVFEDNQRGAVHYTSAGEINPIITMQRNQVANNCISLYGNFSTCQSAIKFDIQNHQDVFFHNNFVTGNIGGLFIKAGSSGTATALRGLLHNNVFEENVKKVTLHLEGRQTSPYQQLTMYRNYITRSDVAHEPVIKLFQVVCNASYNAFHNNKGKYIMEVDGFDNVRLPIYQSFTHNGFYNNFAYGLHCEKTTFGRCRWGSRATVVAGSAGQEYVDNVFYNLNNDYEMVTLNRSVYDVWKTPINAKYNYWGYNETYAVGGRIKDLHDEEGLLEVDFTPFQLNNKTLLSGKCQPGWTLLDGTCYKYVGGPMTFAQAKEFCRKDNATVPYIKNLYWFRTLTQFLETEQEDWRYYDMVWVSDLDAHEGQCKVFVDRTVETVGCDFLLPTLCEMDEHVKLQVDFLKSEFIYAIAAAIVGIFLILIVCCLWYGKSKQRKKERFERRNSIRMSKSSLGSRSLASMASTGFSDVNYRRRIVAQNKTATIVSSNSVQRGGAGRGGSFDSLSEKRSVGGLNSTVEEELRSSFDAYDAHTMSTHPMPSLGSHLSPNGGQQTFADMHEVHYAPNGSSYNFNTGATVHSQFDNAAYRPGSRTPLNASVYGASSIGPPGYPPSSRAEDSVLNLKQELKDQLDNEDTTPTVTTSEETSSSRSSDGGHPAAAAPHDHDYQTMDRTTSTFRPSPQPIHKRSLPSVPPIPSDPGYARPFAHTTSGLPRPPDPPPTPPTESPPRSRSRGYYDPPLETSLDDDTTALNAVNRGRRSRSVGQMLETNFDDEQPSTSVQENTPLNNHSRSLGGSGVFKLSLGEAPLETDM